MEEPTTVEVEKSDTSKNRRALFLLLIVVAVATILSRFITSQPRPQNSSPSGLVPTVATSSLVDVFNGQVTVEAGSFYFKPNIIRVKRGEKVKLTLNSVSMMHDLVIDELSIRTPITKSGETSTVEFTATKVGEFEYYCSVGKHRANGQIGKLIVTD